MSCISPIAPLRDTALELKFDSTFTTARTRFGSTLCRAADITMAESISSAEAWWPRKFAAWIRALADREDSRTKYWLISAAAERAACIEGVLFEGTGFQRFSFALQYIRVGRLGWEVAIVWLAAGASSLT